MEEPCEAIVGPEPLDGLIDALQQAIRTLVAERQAMRRGGATHDELESNRRQLTLRQQQLSYAFIGRQLDPSSRGVAPCDEPRPLAA